MSGFSLRAPWLYLVAANQARLRSKPRPSASDRTQKAAAMERCGLYAIPIIGSRFASCRPRSGMTNSYCPNVPMTGRCWALREPTRDPPSLVPPELVWEPDWAQPLAVRSAAWALPAAWALRALEPRPLEPLPLEPRASEQQARRRRLVPQMPSSRLSSWRWLSWLTSWPIFSVLPLWISWRIFSKPSSRLSLRTFSLRTFWRFFSSPSKVSSFYSLCLFYSFLP